LNKLGYFPGNSLIHKLYPVTKFAWLILGPLFVFLIKDYRLVVLVAGIMIIIIFRIHPKILKTRGFKFAVLTSLSLFLLYILFNKGGDILFSSKYDILNLTSEGLSLGLRISARFLSIILFSYLFILSTNPNDLAYALMKLGIPYRIGFMLVTALRLSPILEEEGQTIYKAQLVRGVQYDGLQIKKLHLLIQQFLTPLLFTAIRRADKLVFSMEGRGFGKYPKRTFRDHTSPTRLDAYVSLGLLIFFSILLVLDIGVIK
jgi:energy-coupling factor transport system permease protein